MKVLVVGAGLAGLLSSYILSKEGYDVVLVERTGHLGGELRTLHYENNNAEEYFFDLGPHIPPKDAYWNDLCKDVETTPVRSPLKSIIKLRQCDLAFPAELSQLIKVPFLLRYGPSFLFSALIKRKELNLRDSLINLYGGLFYRDNLEPYMSKFWGVPPRSISGDFKLRLMRPKMRYLLGNLLVHKDKKGTRERRNDVVYPKYGVGGALSRLIAGIHRNGVPIRTNGNVGKMRNCRNQICVEFKDPKGESRSYFDRVIWTGSVVDLIRALDLTAHGNFAYRKLLLVNYAISKENFLGGDVHESYIIDPRVVFHRVYEPKKISPFMAPKFSTSACAEVTLDSSTTQDVASLIKKCSRDLCSVFSLSLSQIECLGWHLVENAYPMLYANYEENLGRLYGNLGNDFKNIHLVGRTGRYRYWEIGNTIHSAVESMEQILPHHSLRL